MLKFIKNIFPKALRFIKMVNEFNFRFIGRHVGLTYTAIFFTVFASVYFVKIKRNEHLDDKSYVKQVIENSPPAEQISYIGKILRNENFTIDRDLLTKTIHVTPDNSFLNAASSNYYNHSNTIIDGHSFYLILNSDSSYYYIDDKDKKWHLNSIREKIGNNEKAIIVSRNSYIKNCSGNSILFEAARGGRDSINKLVIINQGGGYDIYYYPNTFLSLAHYSEYPDIYFRGNKLYFASIGERKIYSVLCSRYTNNSNNYYIDTVPLPDKTIDVLHLADIDLAVIATAGSYRIESIRAKWQPEAKVLLSEREFSDLGSIKLKYSKQIGNSLIVFNPLNGKIIRQKFIQSTGKFERDSTRMAGGRNFILMNASETFTINSFDENTFWIADESPDTLNICAINFGKKLPKVTYEQYNVNIDNLVKERVNINPSGINFIFSGDKDLWSPSPHILHFDNPKNGTLNCDTSYSIAKLDSPLLAGLKDFRVDYPTYSNQPDFIAFHPSSGLVMYNLKLGRGSSQPDILPIIDNGSENPAKVNWGSEKYFEVISVYDYFFIAILALGGIILYFLGLFYTLDFKNYDTLFNEKELLVFGKLLSLKVKLDSTKRTMQSMKLRSEIMLWLGVVIGLAGMLAFIGSLKILFSDAQGLSWNAGFFVKMLRTLGIFTFMEVFSFYFLKQYRIVFNEYKRFYSLYFRVLNYYHIFEGVNEGKKEDANENSKEYEAKNEYSSALYKMLYEKLLNEDIQLHEDDTRNKIDEFDTAPFSDVIKNLSNKIPDAK